MARLIKTNGEITTVTPQNGEYFTLKELQTLVGGIIQTVWIDDDHVMVTYEESKVFNQPINQKATEMAKDALFPWDCINGDALVCDAEETHLDC